MAWRGGTHLQLTGSQSNARYPAGVTVSFQCRIADVPEGHVVCIVGSTPEIGQWVPKKAKVMRRQCEGLWTRDVTIKEQTTIHYRYFVCQPLLQNGTEISISSVDDLSRVPGLSIVRWESGPPARSLDIRGKSSRLGVTVLDQTKDRWGLTALEPPEQGGQDGAVVSGPPCWSQGWLYNATEIRLRLCGDSPINIWDLDTDNVEIRVRCITLDYSDQSARKKPAMPAAARLSIEDRMSAFLNACAMPVTSYIQGNLREFPTFASTVMVTSLNCGDPRPSPQDEHGKAFYNGDYLSFKTQTLKQEALGFRIEFSIQLNGNFEQIGYSYILPLSETKSCGIKKVPIFSTQALPIGELTVDHLTIRPTSQLNLNMEISYQNYWNAIYKSLAFDAGHRGFGSSFKPDKRRRVSSVKENTIAAIKTAHNYGVKFVEFDVLLCKEKIPVVYHDFHVNLSSHKRHPEDQELYKVGVHELSLAQLQSCKLYHASQISMTLHDENTSPDDHDPFPTLEHCLTSVDELLGFIIEIKYPQLLANGEMEVEQYMDRNMVVDTILGVLFEHGANRKIVLSSFDTDTCSMIQLKQNRYPLLFLNQGECEQYDAYSNYCASTFRAALQFAVSERLVGVDLHSDELLKDMDILRQAQQMGLVVIVWGEINNDPEIKELFKRHQVAVIISDRVKSLPTIEESDLFQIPTATETFPSSSVLIPMGRLGERTSRLHQRTVRDSCAFSTASV